MQKVQIESYLLVTVQFLCAAILIYLALSFPMILITVILLTIAVGIGVWAILTMQVGNFTITSIPKQDAKLIMTGPYRFMRHPMYAVVILATLGLTIQIHSTAGYIIWGVLVLDLLVKLRLEEKLLLEKFTEYREYMKRTKRLMPWIW